RRHVGDIARLPLVEADEHTTLLRDVAHREPRAMPVTPRRAVDRRQERAGTNAGDGPQRILERALLRGGLSRRVEGRERATAADAEMRAPRHDAAGVLEQYRVRTRKFPCRLALERRDRGALTRERAFDEHRLALDAADATAFLVERFDVDGALG